MANSTKTKAYNTFLLVIGVCMVALYAFSLILSLFISPNTNYILKTLNDIVMFTLSFLFAVAGIIISIYSFIRGEFRMRFFVIKGVEGRIISFCTGIFCVICLFYLLSSMFV